MVVTQNIDTLGSICKFSLRGVFTTGQQIYTVIQAVHSILYIVAKCNVFSVVR